MFAINSKGAARKDGMKQDIFKESLALDHAVKGYGLSGMGTAICRKSAPSKP